jgi:hypothetical protein
MWNITWGGNGDDRSNSMAIGNTGSINLVGRCNNNSALFMRYNPSGDLLWNLSVKNGSFFSGWDICIDANDSIYATTSDTTTYHFIKINSSGSIKFDRVISGYASSILYANNSIYGVCSNTISRFYTNGTVMWNRIWNDGQYTAFNGLAISSDNKTIYCAGIDGPIGAFHTILLAYDFNGNQLWNKTWIGGGGVDSATWSKS